jgi:uncharacterized protein (TIRG00374 family)
MSAPAPARTGGRVKTFVGLAITAVCVVYILRQVDVDEVLATLRQAQWSFLCLGLASLACGYALRIFRWSRLLRAADARTGFFDCTAPFLGSIALNNVLPLRAGDVVRALVFPREMGVSRSVATSSLIVERLADLLTLVCCLAIGAYAAHVFSLPPGLLDLALVIVAVAGITLALVLVFSASIADRLDRTSARWRTSPSPRLRLARLANLVANLLRGLAVMSRPGVLLTVFALSMLIWLCEAGLFHFALQSLGIDAHPATSLLIMAIATLSTLVPSSPGYIGSFHLAAYWALTLLGADTTQAGSYAILVHLSLWLPTTLAGAIAIWTRPALFRTARATPV